MYQLFKNKIPWDEMTVPRNEHSFITRRITKILNTIFLDQRY